MTGKERGKENAAIKSTLGEICNRNVLEVKKFT